MKSRIFESVTKFVVGAEAAMLLLGLYVLLKVLF